MQSESKKHEEETPSLHWGMDPVFSAFARLYIKDIHEMKESKQVPGIFFYNGHPVRQVDIVGTVVLLKERDAFYNYGVDDSTGVINCLCWKNPMATETAFSGHPDTTSSLAVLEQMKKLQEMVSQKTKLGIGDVIRVRGCIRTYRQQREVQASCFCKDHGKAVAEFLCHAPSRALAALEKGVLFVACVIHSMNREQRLDKVDDLYCDVQISRMLELPCLYREVYDKPFQGLEEGQSGLKGQNFSISVLLEKMEGFLLENKIRTFYQQELETIDMLVSLAGVHPPSSSCPEVKSESNSSSKMIHSAFKEAIRMLQEKGVVFQKPSSSKDLYHVTDHDKELLKVTLDVIKEDCQKPRHAEKGCHFLHVLTCVRQNYNPSLNEAVIHRVVKLLESNSDIVSSMEGYYIAF